MLEGRHVFGVNRRPKARRVALLLGPCIDS
jgi:hypothetical protein